MARMMALCSVAAHQPRKPDIGISGSNGPYTLYHVRQAAKLQAPLRQFPQRSDAGLGFALKPCRPKAASLILGASLSKVHAEARVSTAAAVERDQTRLRNQMKRLFNGCTVQLVYEG